MLPRTTHILTELRSKISCDYLAEGAFVRAADSTDMCNLSFLEIGGTSYMFTGAQQQQKQTKIPHASRHQTRTLAGLHPTNSCDYRAEGWLVRAKDGTDMCGHSSLAVDSSDYLAGGCSGRATLGTVI